jgi:peptidoglycan/LPS O-acetylase OafA/YrhL
MGMWPGGVVPAEAYLVFANNIFSVSGWGHVSEFMPYWSLAVEEQFYLSSALIAAMFGRKGVIALAIVYITASVGTRAFDFLGWVEFNWWKSILGHSYPIGIGLLAAALATDTRALGCLKRNVTLLRITALGALIVFLGACQFNAGLALGLDVIAVAVAVGCWVLLKIVSRSDSILAVPRCARSGKCASRSTSCMSAGGSMPG